MLITKYTGQSVTITFRLPNPTKLSGVLKESDGVFIVLQQGEGKPDLIVPVVSVLHVEPAA